MQGEVEGAPSRRFTPDLQEGGNGPVGSSELHPSKTPSHTHTTGHFRAAVRLATDRSNTAKDQRAGICQRWRKARQSYIFLTWWTDLYYRRWSPKKRDTLSWDQLVLPQQCRQLVFNIAHDLPMAGHLSTNEMRGRILQFYY